MSLEFPVIKIIEIKKNQPQKEVNNYKFKTMCHN